MTFSRRDIAAGLAGSAILAGCGTGPKPSEASLAAAAPAPTTLYYLGGSRVYSMPAGGGAPRVLVDQSPADGSRAAGLNDGIALDLRRGHIYWTNMGKASERDGYIQRANLDGSNVKMIVPPGGAFTPKQLKIDDASGKLYWSDREGMAIQRCNLDGSQLEIVVITGDAAGDKGDQSKWCVGIAIDPRVGYVYWTQKGADNAGKGTIRRAPLKLAKGATASNRQDVETLFAGLPEPIDIDLDLVGRTIYWTDRGDNTISRAAMDPRGFDPWKRDDRVILVKELKEAIGVALDIPRKRIAFTSLGGEVGTANLNGGDKQILASDQGTLTGIAWG